MCELGIEDVCVGVGVCDDDDGEEVDARAERETRGAGTAAALVVDARGFWGTGRAYPPSA